MKIETAKAIVLKRYPNAQMVCFVAHPSGDKSYSLNSMHHTLGEWISGDGDSHRSPRAAWLEAARLAKGGARKENRFYRIGRELGERHERAILAAIIRRS